MTDEEVATEISLLEQRIDKEMRWAHVDCHKGWHRLILECDKALIALDPDYVPVQIKQKFGGLRFYFDSKADEATRLKMHEVVKQYEELSFQTCELTGNKGVLMNCNGYYQTVDPALAETGWERVEHHDF